MRVKLDIKGLEAHIAKNMAKGLEAGSLYLEGEIKDEIRKPGTGRIYGRHQASAAGEAPASDTGQLLQSVQAIKPEIKGGTIAAGVVANTEYAQHLELGTENMAARPFMGATLYSKLPEIMTVVKANIK